jgi:hypothetical protein
MSDKIEEINPFSVNLEIPVVYLTKKDTFGAGIRYSATPRELNTFVCLYTGSTLQMFRKLSPSSKDMMMYIMEKLNRLGEVDRDYLQLREEEYMEEMECSRSTFIRAKTELLNVVIIPRKSRKGTYWFNPLYFFKGSRMRKYTDKLISVQSPEEQLEKLMQAEKVTNFTLTSN